MYYHHSNHESTHTLLPAVSLPGDGQMAAKPLCTRTFKPDIGFIATCSHFLGQWPCTSYFNSLNLYKRRLRIALLCSLLWGLNVLVPSSNTSPDRTAFIAKAQWAVSCLYKRLILAKTLGHTSLVVIVGHSLTTWGISLALTVYTTKGHLSPQGLLCVEGVPEKYIPSSQLPPGLALSLAAKQGLL